ncbi:sigma 54-interacting transcriptional regulator [Sorangium sp. So ce1389]|uniref:sigma 54-interacting transcriptional regulator n=1 Tax=Sorangium sp. So ce1389 TaxID=3133336 RepID=UPI003F5DA218
MTSSTTLTEPSLLWDRNDLEPPAEHFHLIIAWSREEPHRMGEAALVEGRAVLGRGGPQPQDAAPRLTFHRQRPVGWAAMPPLEGPRISRLQLEVEPTPDGLLAVRSIGRCPLLINGSPATEGLVKAGDTLTLQNALVLFVVRRRWGLEVIQALKEAPRFSFGDADPHGIVGESPAVWSLRGALAFAAQSGNHVLVRGESGAGKELAARAIHALSRRRGGVFVARNAATFPEGLVDAELFGTARGYPNAGSPERPGLIGEADGGTLFLDEIGELPPHLQAHLLRVLDRDGEYQRLGEPRVRRSDLRVIAATNRPVDALKHDFLARFLISVSVPGLPDRREDIPLLLRHLLAAAARDSPELTDRFFERRGDRLAEPRIAPALVDALLRHAYTHHLRELERLMWISLGSSPDNFLALTPDVFAALRPEAGEPRTDPRAGPRATDPGRTTDPGKSNPPQPSDSGSIGRAEIEAALAEAQGSVTGAARLLGLKNRFALYRLMKRHGIAGPDEETSEG